MFGNDNEHEDDFIQVGPRPDHRTEMTVRELEQRTSELEALESITEVGLAFLELDPLLEQLLQRIVHFEEAQAGIIFLIEGSDLVVRKSAGIPESELRGLTVTPGGGFAGRVANLNSSIAISDAAREPWALSDYARRYGVRSLLGVPLRTGEKVIGAVELHFAEVRDFDLRETRLLNIMAERAAMAIDRARLVEQMQDQRNFLETVLENTPAALATVAAGPRHTVEFANNAFINIFSPKAIGQLAEEVFDVEISPGETVWDRVNNTGNPVVLQAFEYHSLDRGLTYWDLYFWPIKDSHERIQHVLMMGWDTTSHVEARQRLEQLTKIAEERAVELEKEKERRERFVSMVAHDLRGPVVVLQGYAQLLKDWEKMPADRRDRAIDAIVTQTRRLDWMIEDLLDVTRIATGEFTIQKERTDLVELAQKVVEEQQVTTNRHPIILDAPIRLEGNWDEQRLAQALTNLIGNAIKYSPKGGRIWVRIRQVDDNARVCVQDEGIGIAPEEIKLLFEPFARTEEASTMAGIGLGLYITKGIVIAHGGQIWVESPGRGKGSTFCFTLPLDQS